MTRRQLCAPLLALLAACSGPGADSAAPTVLTVGVMPKLIGIDYFNACERGAVEAGAELGVEVVYDGPLVNDVTRQAEMLDAWITRGFDVIAVAPNDPHALAPTLKRARGRGTPTLTWDADSDADSRSYFVNQAPARELAQALVEVVADQIGGDGPVAIVTGSLAAANQNIWIEHMRAIVAETYPEMSIVAVKASEEDQQLAFRVTQDLLKAHPDLEGLFAVTTVALPGAAEAIRQSGRSGEIALTGVATPNQMRPYVADGTVPEFVLWNPVDLGYLTVHVALRLHRDGTLPARFEAGRLGEIEVRGDEVLLGPPLRFHEGNIDDFAF